MIKDNAGIFKSWVPGWLIVFVLVFCMLHSMVLLGVYTSNITYSASFLDIEPEDLQFSLCVTYGTFLATLLVESRLFKYFPTKSYFLVIYSLASVVFVLSGYTENYILFLVLRMVEGVLMALPWLPMRQLLFTRFTSRNATIVVFSLNYAALLLASPFIMNIAVWLLDNYDWKYMVYGSAVFQLMCVGLILVTFTNNRFHRKLPLYQIDWASFVLVLAAILCGTFVFIYGEKKYWFDSGQVVAALVFCLLSMALFVMRQLWGRRPVFDFKVFSFANLRIGFLLFILFYISRATLNICHSTMLAVWNWEPSRVAGVQYFNVLGNGIGMVLAGLFLMKKIPHRYTFSLGFALMAVYHLWFTFLFVPDVALADIVIPYVIQGISVGVLFVPMVLFTVSSVPAELAPYSGTTGVAGRFWGSTIGFCIMQNAQVYLTRFHVFQLNRNVLPETAQAQERISQLTANFATKGYAQDDAYRLAIKSITAAVSKQSLLLAEMEIFTVIGYVLIAVSVLLLCNRHLRMTVDIFKNKVWGS